MIAKYDIHDDNIHNFDETGFKMDKVSENYDANFTVQRRKKNNALIFWGSLAGTYVGSSAFWERDWGMMSAAGH